MMPLELSSEELGQQIRQQSTSGGGTLWGCPPEEAVSVPI